MKRMSMCTLLLLLSCLGASLPALATHDYRWPEATPRVLVPGLKSWDDSQRYQVVVFVSAQCPCSASHESVLRTLYGKFHSQVEFLGVHSNADENETQSRKHFTETALPFAVIEDAQGQWAQQFAAMKTPHAYVIDTQTGKTLYQGGVTGSHYGPTASEHPLEEALDALLAGREIPKARARVLGCAISRRK